jgi:hypothetical protein
MSFPKEAPPTARRLSPVGTGGVGIPSSDNQLARARRPPGR